MSPNEFARPGEPTCVLAGRHPEAAAAVELFAYKIAQAIERGEYPPAHWARVREELEIANAMRRYAAVEARRGASEPSSNYFLARGLLAKHAPAEALP